MEQSGTNAKLPEHMKVRLPMALESKNKATTRDVVESKKLVTVCEEAACPNLSHCWQSGTATFMIMGKICTRRCKFCNIKTARPQPLDADEPQRLAQAIKDMKLKHAVITSVDRDELQDCGSSHFALCIDTVKKANKDVVVEVLIPDFQAQKKNLEKIWKSKPHIINHNVETVEPLYKTICPQSNYKNSLDVLQLSKEQGFTTKSGLILGLGESKQDVRNTILDLAKTKIGILTIGQYLQPTQDHASVARFVDPEEFKDHKEFALKAGIRFVESGPLVRSSYHAKESFDSMINVSKA